MIVNLVCQVDWIWYTSKGTYLRRFIRAISGRTNGRRLFSRVCSAFCVQCSIKIWQESFSLFFFTFLPATATALWLPVKFSSFDDIETQIFILSMWNEDEEHLICASWDHQIILPWVLSHFEIVQTIVVGQLSPHHAIQSNHSPCKMLSLYPFCSSGEYAYVLSL